MKIIKYYIFIIFLIAFSTQPLLGQNHEIDSLLALIKKDKDDTLKVKHTFDLSNEYTKLSEFDKGIDYSKQALILAKRLNFTKGIATSYKIIGNNYIYLGDYPEALKSHLTSLKFYESLKDKKNIANAYNNIGIIYFDQGNYSESLKNHLLSLKIREELKELRDIASSYNNLANIYSKQSNHSEALKKYFAALAIYKKIKDEFGIAYSYDNIGVVYNAIGNYSEALKNHLAALKLFQQLNDEQSSAITYQNIGIIYEAEGKHSEALKNHFIALNLMKKFEDKSGIASSLINLGYISLDINKNNDAKQYLNNALSISKEIGDKDEIKETYRALAKADSATNDFQKAYIHYKMYIIYRDSLINEENQKKDLQATMQYDFDKKESATKFETNKIVSDLENQNKLQKQKQFFLIIFIVVFITLVLVVLFFAKRAYDNKKKYSEVLSKENEHKELLLREVHHRVNNSLQMISSLLSIQADTTTNEEIREYLLKSENRIQAMSTMHHLLHMGNSKLEVNINQYLSEIINFYSKVLESNPAIKLHIEIPSVNFHTKTALPLALLLNELLTNSIKYAFPNNKGDIQISLTQVNDSNQWVFKLSDNGIGFEEGDIGGKGTGLGLSLVKLMSRQISSKLSVYHNSGTAFELIFSETTA